MSQSVDERREHRPQAQSTSIYSVALLIPLVGQGARAGVSLLQLPEIFAPLTTLVFPGSPRGRLGAAAPLRESHAPGERLALRTQFLRFRRRPVSVRVYTMADLYGKPLSCLLFARHGSLECGESYGYLAPGAGAHGAVLSGALIE